MCPIFQSHDIPDQHLAYAEDIGNSLLRSKAFSVESTDLQNVGIGEFGRSVCHASADAARTSAAAEPFGMCTRSIPISTGDPAFVITISNILLVCGGKQVCAVAALMVTIAAWLKASCRPWPAGIWSARFINARPKACDFCLRQLRDWSSLVIGHAASIKAVWSEPLRMFTHPFGSFYFITLGACS